jgi:hypothetical protein
MNQNSLSACHGKRTSKINTPDASVIEPLKFVSSFSRTTVADCGLNTSMHALGA